MDSETSSLPVKAFGKIQRRGAPFLLALAGVFALDTVCFRSGFYLPFLEPDSSAGVLEMVLRRELRAQERYGDNLIVTLGDSRFAYYPRVANELTPKTGFAFRHAGVAGTDMRVWNYILRDLDPTRQRYRAIVLGVVDYDDEDGAYDVANELTALHYLAARLRLGDAVDFASSFPDPAARWSALRGALLKGFVLQQDILGFLSHPLKRIDYVRLCRTGYEDWTYGFVETSKNVVGLKIAWANLTAVLPTDDPALREQLKRFVLYRPYPQTGKYAAYRRKWFGRLIEAYRGSRTKIVFLRLPRGPIPRPDNLVAKQSSSIREFASLPGVIVANEHAFESLENPDLFKDAFHLNDAGCARMSVMMAEEVSRIVK